MTLSHTVEMSLIHVQHHNTESCRHYGIFFFLEVFLLHFVLKIQTLAVLTVYKVQILWAFLWMSFCIYNTQSLSSVCNLRIKDIGEEFGFYQEGDFIIGGVFTIRAGTSNVKGTNSYVKEFYSEE